MSAGRARSREPDRPSTAVTRATWYKPGRRGPAGQQKVPVGRATSPLRGTNHKLLSMPPSPESQLARAVQQRGRREEGCKPGAPRATSSPVHSGCLGCYLLAPRTLPFIAPWGPTIHGQADVGRTPRPSTLGTRHRPTVQPPPRPSTWACRTPSTYTRHRPPAPRHIAVHRPKLKFTEIHTCTPDR